MAARRLPPLKRRLARRVLVVAQAVTPKLIAPNLSSLFDPIDARDHAILTIVDGIAEGAAAGKPWLPGRYFFCGDPAATRETAARRPPEASVRRRARLVRAAARLGVRRPLRWIEGQALVFTRAARLILGGLRAVRETRCQLVLGLSDNGAAIVATYVVARLTRRPYAYYLLDLYLGNDLRWAERWMATLLEGRLFRDAECVATGNAVMADYYRRRYGEQVTVDVVPIVPAGLAAATAAPPYDPTPPYTIVYTGSVYWPQWQALANVIRAMDQLRDLPLTLRIYCLHPPPELTDMTAGRDNVWLGAARPSEMARIQREATLLLVALAWHTRAPDIIATATPGKAIEYLASGRPLLVHAPDYAYMSRHARKHALGLVVDEDDPTALAREIRRYLAAPEVGQEYARNARAMFHERHDPRAAAERMAAILNGKHARGAAPW